MPLRYSEIFKIIDASIQQNLIDRKDPIIRAKYDVACVLQTKNVTFAQSECGRLKVDEFSLILPALSLMEIVVDTLRELQERHDYSTLHVQALEEFVLSIQEGAYCAAST